MVALKVNLKTDCSQSLHIYLTQNIVYKNRPHTTYVACERFY